MADKKSDKKSKKEDVNLMGDDLPKDQRNELQRDLSESDKTGSE